MLIVHNVTLVYVYCAHHQIISNFYRKKYDNNIIVDYVYSHIFSIICDLKGKSTHASNSSTIMSSVYFLFHQVYDIHTVILLFFMIFKNIHLKYKMSFVNNCLINILLNK